MWLFVVHHWPLFFVRTIITFMSFCTTLLTNRTTIIITSFSTTPSYIIVTTINLVSVIWVMIWLPFGHRHKCSICSCWCSNVDSSLVLTENMFLMFHHLFVFFRNIMTKLSYCVLHFLSVFNDFKNNLWSFHQLCWSYANFCFGRSNEVVIDEFNLSICWWNTLYMFPQIH